MVKKKKKEHRNRSFKEDYAKNKEIYWIFGAIIVLVLVFFATYFGAQAISKFNYQGLVFTKEKFGEIPVYHYFYYYNNDKGETVKYNFYLRIDPRKNNVPLEGEIEFLKGKFVYISVNGTDLTRCPYSSVAIASLAGFLTDNEITVRGASPDKAVANESKVVYADCENHPNNVVVLIQKAERTQVTKQGRCHIIDVADCQILDAVEKFEVQAILDAKNSTI